MKVNHDIDRYSSPPSGDEMASFLNASGTPGQRSGKRAQLARGEIHGSTVTISTKPYPQRLSDRVGAKPGFTNGNKSFMEHSDSP